LTIRAVTPIAIDALLDLWIENGLAKPWQVSAAILQAARGESVGFYAGEILIAAAVLYPRDDGLEELIFAARPAAARHMLTIVRHARLTAARLPDDCRIGALCRRDNHAGRRLAWLIGMRPAGVAGAFKRYELAHGKIRRRHQVTFQRARHVGAGRADQAGA
jgi:hypothetical protein